MPRRAHCLQHVPFEGPGSIGPWLAAAGYELTTTRLWEAPVLPDPCEPDFIVAMGGPMSVNDEAELPWLVAEKRFVREAIAAGKPVLGVCLGAQLIASALGASVYRNPEREIGWFDVQGVDPGAGASFRFPPSSRVFHWHGETFDLPPGAIRLARSAACGNQAFQFGRSVIGLQFHLETTPESARALIGNCRTELQPATWVQSEAELLATPPAAYRAINALMERVLVYLTRPA
ncbi:MAG: type 1 glutamine amidotransferase [Gammaproteobacteria bacterium]|nr:type 1 glutamine amidotransferase [Gammaproteobacteria bacterium]